MTVDNVNIKLSFAKQSGPDFAPHGRGSEVGVGRVEPTHLTLGLILDLNAAIIDSLITVALDSWPVLLPYFRVAPDGLAEFKVRILSEVER